MKIKTKLKQNIDAFTLIEVMVVLAIIGILASFIDLKINLGKYYNISLITYF